MIVRLTFLDRDRNNDANHVEALYCEAVINYWKYARKTGGFGHA